MAVPGLPIVNPISAPSNGANTTIRRNASQHCMTTILLSYLVLLSYVVYHAALVYSSIRTHERTRTHTHTHALPIDSAIFILSETNASFHSLSCCNKKKRLPLLLFFSPRTRPTPHRSTPPMMYTTLRRAPSRASERHPRPTSTTFDRNSFLAQMRITITTGNTGPTAVGPSWKNYRDYC